MTEPSPVAHPHDRLFKSLMERPDSAAALLHERLPPELATRLDAGSIERLPGSFIDEALGAHETDVLFRARTTDGTQALLYVLVEHWSHPAPHVALRLLRYLTRIWTQLDRDDPSAPLPPIVPLILYHGAEAWSPATFAGLFPPDPVLRPYLPDFAFALADLGRIPDAELSAERTTRAVLRALKYAFRQGGQSATLLAVADDLAGQADLVKLVFLYILQVFQNVGQPELREALRRAVPGQEEQMASIFAEEMMAKGHAKGLAEGEARALMVILESRFGPVSEVLRTRIQTASPVSLEGWLRAAATAPTLNAVFDDPTTH